MNERHTLGLFNIRFTETIMSTEMQSRHLLSKTPTQPNITLSWVRHENDFAHHPPPPQKLNVSNISAVTDPILCLRNVIGKILI